MYCKPLQNITTRRCTDVALKDLVSFTASHSTSYQTPGMKVDAFRADQRRLLTTCLSGSPTARRSERNTETPRATSALL